MKRQSGAFSVLIILVVGVLIASAIYWFRPQPKTRPAIIPKPPLVSAIRAAPSPYQVTVSTQGTVMPSRQIDLVAEVSGRVLAVNERFANGTFFSENDSLVRLDDRDYRYRAVEASAQVATAERELALERGQARQAKREWRDLGSKEANALSLRQPQVKAAKAQLASAVAQQQQSELNVQRTNIRAPFSGRIQTTHVNVGQYVAAGTVVATVYDSTLAEVRLPLTDRQLALINLPLGATLESNQQVDVVLSASLAGKHYQWPAKLVRTEASVDTRTRFYFGVVEIPQPFDSERYQAPLIVGLFVEASISGRRFDHVLQLPEKSVIDNQFVFTVDDDDTLQRRNVSVVSKANGVAWVRSDILADERIVVSDPNVLQNQTVVTVKLLDAPVAHSSKVEPVQPIQSHTSS